MLTCTDLLGAAAEAALIATGSPYMAATVPFLIAAVYVLQKVYLRTSQQLRVLELETRGPLYANFLETLDGVSRFAPLAGSWIAKANARRFLTGRSAHTIC